MTNHLLWYGIPIPPVGNISIALFIPLLAYAIIAHHLLDIEVIIKRTLVFAGIVAAAVSIIAFPFVLIQAVIGRALGVPDPFILMALGIATAVLIYRPVERALVNITDRHLFQKKFDYRILLKEASREMAAIKSLSKLAKVVVAFLIKRARISSVAVFVELEKDHQYVLRAGRPRYHEAHRSLDSFHPLIQLLKKHERPLSLEELVHQSQTGASPEEREGMLQAVTLMKALKAEAVVPSFLYLERKFLRFFKNEPMLRSLLFLGPKKSDEPYRQEDLDVFFTLAQESAIAIENARLFDEAVKRTEELRQINRELEQTNQRLHVTQASLIVAEKSATMVGMAKAIGHEINNPLTTVMGRAESLQGGELKKLKEFVEKSLPSFSEEDGRKVKAVLASIEDQIGRIRKAGGRINVVVETLTNILKDAKGEMRPLSLAVLCREAIEAVRFSTYEENLSGSTLKEGIGQNVFIFGNLEQLVQVFVNLIKNAYEAMKGQRERRVEIRGDFDPDDPAMARIEVRDNGPGIPAEALPKIWLQGFSTKERKDSSMGAAGQGQGLYVCKHVIESIHKGSILAENRPEGGAAFVIKLPLAEVKEHV